MFGLLRGPLTVIAHMFHFCINKLFSSVMFFVGIIVNNLFTFSVSTLTFFQFWFLGDGNVVFLSVMIFIMSSRFILSSSINICFVVLGSVAFRLSLFCFSIFFSVFVHIFHYLFVHRKLTWLASLWLVVLNVVDFAQISI